MRSLPLLVLALSFGCAPGTTPPGSTPTPPPPEDLELVAVTVAYEAGAEPYTGSAGVGQGDTWALFEDNVAALFAGTGVSVTSPSALSEMTEFAADGQSGYDVDALLALGAQHGTPGGDGTTFGISALWLDGRFVRDGEEQAGVLGVSIGDTGVIALFKPVIESLGGLEVVRRFGEQATLIHEFGHAVGLVNNGAPALAAHHDEEHGAHCSNDRCVMYWANEGAGDLAEFVQQVVLTGDSVIFDDDCLDDVQAHYGG